MYDQQEQQLSPDRDEETKPFNALAHPRTEQVRYPHMPAGPVIVDFPPSFGDILLENRFAQMATVDQQRELMQYTRRLDDWMGREVGERHGDLSRLRALFEQIRQDVRDWQDEEESTSSTSRDKSETNIQSGIQPQEVPGMLALLPYSTVPRPVIPPVIPNQRQPPRHLQSQPVPSFPGVYAPRPVPAAPRLIRPRQLPSPQLLPPQQPATRATPEPPPFIPPDFSQPDLRPFRTSTPASISMPARPGVGRNVVVVPESSASSPGYLTPGNQSGRASADQPLPFRPIQAMGSDVSIIPLSTSSTRSSTPARGMSRLAPRGSVASLRGRGMAPSGILQGSRSNLVLTSPSPPSPVIPTPLPAQARPATPYHIAAMRQPAQWQPVIRPLASPSPAAVMSTSGPEQFHGFPMSRPPPGPIQESSFAPLRGPNARLVGPVTGLQSPPIIRQHSPVSGHRRGRTPTRTTHPVTTRVSPTRLSRRHRPRPMAGPVPGMQPSQPVIRAPPHREAILMPTQAESMRNRQNRLRLRPIDTSVVIPPHAVTAMTYPQTGSHVRYSGTPLIIPGSSSGSGNGAFRTPMGEHPAFIRKCRSRSSSRHRRRPHIIPVGPIRRVVSSTSPSRLTRQRRREPTITEPVLPSQPIRRRPSPSQPEIVLMRRRQSRHQLHPNDTSTVTSMFYPESVSQIRTTSRRPPTPYIVPQRSLLSSDDISQSPTEHQRGVIRRSSSRSLSRRGPIQGPVDMNTSVSRLTKRRRPPPTADPILRSQSFKRAPLPSRPEVVLMPARADSIHGHQSHHQHQLRRIDPSAVMSASSVTAMTYPESIRHVRTRPPTPFISPRASPVSSDSDSSSRSRIEAERPAVIRRSPSPSSSHHRRQPSRLTRRRPHPTTAPEPIVLPQPEIFALPAQTESLGSRQSRRQLRPFDTATDMTPAVTTMSYPQVSHGRMTAQRPPTPFVVPQDSPVSSSGSRSRPSMQVAERPAAVRASPSHSSIHHTSHNIAIPIPVVPASQPIGNIISSSGPGIVVMPARSSSLRSLRRGRVRDHSSDSSDVILSDVERDSNPVAQPGHDAGSHSSLPPQSGAVVVPLDSEAEEAMGMHPPTLSRRASFSGRDWVRASSVTGSYSRRRSRSPWENHGRGGHQETQSYSSDDSDIRPHTPNSRMSRSPPRIYRPTSTDFRDRKSRSRSQGGWYRRRSISTSSPPLYDNSLLVPPASHRRAPSRGHTRKIKTQISTRDLTVGEERRKRGSARNMLEPELRRKKSWLTWMGNL